MNVISPIEIILFILSVVGSQDVRDVKQVHLVFMNHLDVGYDGISPELGFVNNVLNKYFHVYFPRAIKVASELRGLGYNERMIYTTHAWLVSMFLDCPPNMVLAGVKLKCPNVTEIEAFNKAVRLGDITWHAGPMNMQNEMLDPSMVDFSLQMVSDLHFYYNFSRPVKTLSQRDVPGMTQALLPIFSKHGIQGITVGVNGATLPPSVPKIFNWKYKNNSIIAMWHPGGYPNHPGYFPSMPGGLSAKDCVTYPGFNQALCFAFRNDNDGPPMSIQEVLLYYEISRNQFPNAFVQGSTFDGFVSAAQSIKDQLPVIEKEIGDVWIQGVASDPFKVAHMRAFYRARSDCFDKAVAVAVSCFTLVAISLERYFAICRPLKSRRWQTRTHAYKVIVVCWLLAFFVMAPVAVYHRLGDAGGGVSTCREKWNNEIWEKAYTMILNMILLVIPVIIMSLAYGWICYTLWIGMRLEDQCEKEKQTIQRDTTNGVGNGQGVVSVMSDAEYPMNIQGGNSGRPFRRMELQRALRQSNSNRSRAAKKRVIKMLFAVVLEFFICWAPAYIIYTWMVYDYQSARLHISNLTKSLIHLLSYVSSCCNPITYCFLNKNFRQAFIAAFRCCRKKHYVYARGSAMSFSGNTNSTRTMASGTTSYDKIQESDELSEKSF